MYACLASSLLSRFRRPHAGSVIACMLVREARAVAADARLG